jgi:hypothetical protein
MKKTITGLFLTTLIFSACNKDETPTTTVDPRAFSVTVNGSDVTVKNMGADTILGIGAMGPYGAGKYTFFSLATNSIVPSSDSATTNWDLAFSGKIIRVNSGTSGPGVGGAFVYTGTYDALTSVPTDSTFRTDAAPSYAITAASGKGWYTYDPANNLIIPTPGRVLVIKTATGKYAKVEILNYYRGGTTPAATATDSVKAYDSRYYSFRYNYQRNGTMVF